MIPRYETFAEARAAGWLAPRSDDEPPVYRGFRIMCDRTPRGLRSLIRSRSGRVDDTPVLTRVRSPGGGIAVATRAIAFTWLEIRPVYLPVSRVRIGELRNNMGERDCVARLISVEDWKSYLAAARRRIDIWHDGRADVDGEH